MTTTTPMDTLSVLLRARAAISSPKKWCIGYRHDGYGRHCALGAIEVALETEFTTFDVEESPAVLALDLSIPADRRFVPHIYASGRSPSCATERVARYNNRSDHKTVLAWFDRAIENTRTVNALAELPTAAEQPVAVEPVE
jgi:hypothetical protein